jgi:Na+/proline symporter
MLIYVLLSGWRGVVWAEVLQGALLWLAIVVAAVVLVQSEGGLATVIREAVTVAPEKVTAPASFATLTRSYLLVALVFGMGGAMYPQIVQSVYAARSERDLRHGLVMMIPNYFIVMLAVVLIGLVGIVRLHDLKTIEADQVLGLLLARRGESWYGITILVFLGAAAAIMSTAAGVLLTLSSMMTHNMYRHFIRSRASERELATVGRIFTALILVLVTALSLRPLTTLWNLTIIRFEFLMQLYVPLILGLYWARFSRAAAFTGLGTGTLCVAAMMFSGWDHISVFDAGLCGTLVNLTCSVGVAFLKQTDETEQLRAYKRFFSLFHSRTVIDEAQPRPIVVPLSSAPE